MTLVNDSKIEIIDKFYGENITFSSFNVLNASIPRQNFFFRLLNKCPTLVSISLLIMTNPHGRCFKKNEGREEKKLY